MPTDTGYYLSFVLIGLVTIVTGSLDLFSASGWIGDYMIILLGIITLVGAVSSLLKGEAFPLSDHRLARPAVAGGTVLYILLSVGYLLL